MTSPPQERRDCRGRPPHGGFWGSLFIKVAYAGFGLLSSALLARVLDVREFGVYTYLNTIVMVLAVISALGLPNVIMRSTAAYLQRGQLSLLKGLLWWGTAVVLTASSIACVTTISLAVALNDKLGQIGAITVLLGLMIVPFQTVNSIRAGALRGLGHVILGQLPDLLVRPVVFTVLIVLVYFVFRGVPQTAAIAFGLQFGAVAVACAVGSVLMHQNKPRALNSSQPDMEVGFWLRAALPFLVIELIQMVNNQTAILMLGPLMGAESVALYQVAMRGADLITFGLQAAGMALAPRIAALYAVKDYVGISELLARAGRMTLAVTVPVALLLIFGGEWILQAVFGNDYRAAASTLGILSVGTVIYIAIGMGSFVLNMTEYEKYSAVFACCALIINVVLNALLIPKYGLHGAAIAAVVSMIWWNGSITIFSRAKLGFWTTVIQPKRRLVSARKTDTGSEELL